MARARKTAERRTASRKTKRRTRRKGPFGYLCLDSQVCFRLETRFDKTTIKLVSIDLYDEDATDKDKVWLSVSPPFSNQATKAALRALRRAATNGTYTIELCTAGCECRLSGNWGPWTAPQDIKISGGFSIPGARYRANGTVSVETRLQGGACYRIQ